jgi:hypothetical protein
MVIMLSVCQANGDNVLQTMGIRERLGMILAMCLPFVIVFLLVVVGRLEELCRYDYSAGRNGG